MSSYLPQKTFVVCTLQMSPTKGELLADGDARSLSVIHSKKDAVLLTKDDLVLLADFGGCQNKWMGPVLKSLFAFGVALGATLAAVTIGVLTLGVGAIIIGACAVATAAYIATKSNSTKCKPLLTAWQNPHPTVKFDQVNAVTQTSFITCGAGGMLQPFISASAADNAASEIASTNKTALVLSGIISFMFGFAVGHSGGLAGFSGYAGGATISSAFGSALSAGVGEFLIGTIGAYAVYAPLTYGQEKLQQWYYSSDDEKDPYDRLQNQIEEAKGDKNENIPELLGFQYDSLDDDFNPTDVLKKSNEAIQSSWDIYRTKQNDAFIKQMMNVKGTKAEKRAQIEAIAKEMSKTRSGAQAVREMRRKGSGEIVIRTKTEAKGNKVTAAHRAEARGARRNSIKKMATPSNVSLLLPFVVTYLEEKAVRTFADFMQEDITNGNTISSTTH